MLERTFLLFEELSQGFVVLLSLYELFGCELAYIKSAFFLSLPEYEATLFENKKNKVTVDLAKQILSEALPLLEAAESFDNDTLYSLLLTVAEKLACKSGAVMWSLRIAVSGLAVTPGGATEIMEVVGKEEAIRRIKLALEK